MDQKTNSSPKKRGSARKRKNPVLIWTRRIIAVLIIGMACFFFNRYIPSSSKADLNAYYGKPQEGEAAIILGSQILEVRAKTIAGDHYLPLSFVTGFLNPVFYWDTDLGEILYTTPKQTIRTPIQEEAGGDAFLDGDAVYLSLDLVRAHTDLDVTEYQDPDRIAIQNDFTDLKLVRTMAKGNIRVLGGIKSRILAPVLSGTDLILLDEEVEGWSHVASWDGYIGYIETRKLNPVTEVTLERNFEEEKYSYIQMSAPVNLVWHVIGQEDGNSMLVQDVQPTSGVNVISPTWFSVLNNNGDIQDFSSYDYVSQAHSLGMQVWGLVDNFGPDFTTFELLSHYESRQNLIRNLMNAALESGMDGINIDFETLKPEAISHFVQFLRELSVETHQNGLILSVDDPVPETYSIYYRRDLQAKAADYIIIMGYDEHYNGSETPGSVASMPWVEQGIRDTIREVPASRTILGMPFYTRVWKTQAGALSSVAYGMRAAAGEAAAADTSYWNTDVMQNYAQWEQEGIKYQVWLEDVDSIRERMNLIVKYNLAGAAAWRLGFEVPEVWQEISDGLAKLGA